MSKIARFIIWICSKFTRNEIEQIVAGLSDVLNNRNPETNQRMISKRNIPITEISLLTHCRL